MAKAFRICASPISPNTSTEQTGDPLTLPENVSRFTAGIIGVGTMGSGLAYAFASCGHSVRVADRNPAALSGLPRLIDALNQQASLFISDRPLLSAEQLLSRISVVQDLSDLNAADFVIETISENLAQKESLYRRFASEMKTTLPLFSGTSCMPIRWLASFLPNPGRFMGVHFMNPAHLMRTVETIPGDSTTPETVACAERMLASIGKTGIAVGDGPGFVSNRILMRTINDAAQVVFESRARAEAVDDVFRRCMGHRMGPLETADLIGIDVILDSLAVLKHFLPQEHFDPCPLLVDLASRNHLGKKTGHGFYSYQSF